MTAPSRILTAKTIKPALCIMMDDAPISNYTIAFDEMYKKRGIRATSNLPTGLIGTSQDYLNWAQVQEMYNAGWGFGCHGHTHTRFTDLTDEQLHAELQAVNADYTSHGMPTPIHCAPPAAMWTDTQKAIILQYRQAILGKQLDALTIPINYRRKINFSQGFDFVPHWNVHDMNTDAGLNYFKNAIDQTVKQREVLIVFMHYLVDELSDPYTTMELTRTRFTAFLDYGLSKKINFLTFNELFNYVNQYQSEI